MEKSNKINLEYNTSKLKVNKNVEFRKLSDPKGKLNIKNKNGKIPEISNKSRLISKSVKNKVSGISVEEKVKNNEINISKIVLTPCIQVEENKTNNIAEECGKETEEKCIKPLTPFEEKIWQLVCQRSFTLLIKSLNKTIEEKSTDKSEECDQNDNIDDLHKLTNNASKELLPDDELVETKDQTQECSKSSKNDSDWSTNMSKVLLAEEELTEVKNQIQYLIEKVKCRCKTSTNTNCQENDAKTTVVKKKNVLSGSLSEIQLRFPTDYSLEYVKFLPKSLSEPFLCTTFKSSRKIRFNEEILSTLLLTLISEYFEWIGYKCTKELFQTEMKKFDELDRNEVTSLLDIPKNNFAIETNLPLLLDIVFNYSADVLK